MSASPSMPAVGADSGAVASADISLAIVADLLWQRRALLFATTLSAMLLAFGATWLLPNAYTAKTSFIPPQQQPTGVAGALASLGPLAALGGIAPARNMGDQYVALMQSTLVVDRLIDRFKLIESYEVEFRADARRKLRNNARIALGRKDGMVMIEVDHHDPRIAAEIANAHVEELRLLLSKLAVTEAQQRRQFFETQLEQAQERLIRSQIALQASGFTQGALRAEPKAAAEEYGRLRAEVTAAEVRVQTMRGYLADGAPELRQAQGALAALRDQLARTERASSAPAAGRGGSDYISKYRDFKYNETLFELFARQYEIARVDESRENAPIQVIDVATPPEKPSGPRRVAIASIAGIVMLLLLFVVLVMQVRRQAHRPAPG